MRTSDCEHWKLISKTVCWPYVQCGDVVAPIMANDFIAARPGSCLDWHRTTGIAGVWHRWLLLQWTRVNEGCHCIGMYSGQLGDISIIGAIGIADYFH